MSYHVRRERRGDSTITTLLTAPHRTNEMQSIIEVYSHANGGVTLLRRDSRGEEIARISVVREVWDAIVDSAGAGAGAA